MKKIIFFVIAILVGIGAVYKMDIKPQVKDVIKQVAVTEQAKPAAAPAAVNTAPTQNVPE